MTKTRSYDPITVTGPKAVEISGIGRTKLYQMMAADEIQSVRVGKRRLIVFESLRQRLSLGEAEESI